MEQLKMFDIDLNPVISHPTPASPDGVYLRWLKYCVENPHVEEELIRLVRKAQSEGLYRYGIQGLFNIIRWNIAIKTKGDTFKISNDYSPHYARLLIRKYPETRKAGGFFRLKKTSWESPAEFNQLQALIENYR